MSSVEDVYKQLQALMPTHSRAAEPASAASVVLARPSETLGAGMEVFLVQRSFALSFLPGFWAFPGGKHEAQDGSIEEAGLRELAEETGVVATPSQLVPIGRYVTPPESAMRFDTHFYVLPVERDCVADVAVSGGELIDGRWWTIPAALDAFAEGTLLVALPVLRVLEALSGLAAHSDGAWLDASQNYWQEATRLGSAQAEREVTRPRLWDLAAGVALSPLRTPTLPPATHTNCYVIGANEFVVIDPASPFEEEQSALITALRVRVEAGDRPLAVLLTHHHLDHVGAAQRIAEEFGVPIAAHEATAELLQGRVKVERLLAHGERIELSGPRPRSLECHFTPGHAPGHLCFFETATRCLVAGDMVASVGTILIDPSEGDMAAYLESLRHLQALGPRLILPAHGMPVTDPQRLLSHYIAHRLAREAKVVAALGAAPQKLAALVNVVYADTPVALHGLAMRSLLSHLHKLAAEGHAQESAQGWVSLPS